MRSSSTKTRHNPFSAESRATEVTKVRREEGHFGTSDETESLPKAEKKSEIVETLVVDDGLPESTASRMAGEIVDQGLKYCFAHAALETSAFFTVKPRGGSIIVTLNTKHSAYTHLVEVLEESIDVSTAQELRERLLNALTGLKLLLCAWARYEDEQPDGRRKENVQDARSDWGKVARDFLSNDD